MLVTASAIVEDKVVDVPFGGEKTSTYQGMLWGCSPDSEAWIERDCYYNCLDDEKLALECTDHSGRLNAALETNYRGYYF